LPDDAPNRHAAAATVSALARRHPVVLLNTGLRFDDHEELSIAEQDGRVIPVLDGVPPGRNLGAQAAAIAGSRAFFGTYGGLSYLAPALGVPSFAFYSQPEFFARAHLDYARRVARGAGTSLTCIDLRRAHALELLDLA
jgi:ADP-heptose:LPS heptosyltransferase